MTDYETILSKLKDDLITLRERKDRHGGSTRQDLQKKIDDLEQAIALTQQVIDGELTEAEWREMMKPLLVSLSDQDRIVIAENIGVVGDFVHVDEIHFHNYTTPSGKPLQRPPRAERFTDRKDELKKLLADLQPGKVVTLCGPGGIGKSALAAEAVWMLAPGDKPPDRFPDGVIWHSFYNHPKAELALEKIALAFGDKPKPTPRDGAQRALANRQALLLLDGTEDADDLRSVLEIRDRCGVLVTSRKRKDAVSEWQDVTPLEPDEAVKLLRAWGKDRATDSTAARQICQLVGYLPLALRLVGRFLNETEESAVDYLNWLEDTPLEALDQGQRRERSVPALLEKSLAQVSESACEVLGVVGLLALAPLNRTVLAVALDREENELRRPLDELVSYGLLMRRGEWHEVSHALIHTYVREMVLPKPETTWRLAEHYTKLVEKESEKGPEGYTRLDMERAHIMRLLVKCVEEEDWSVVRNLTWTLSSNNSFLEMQGYSVDLVMVIEKGLNTAHTLGNSREKAVFLGRLGNAYHVLGQVEQAIEYLKQALAIDRKISDRRGEGADLGRLGNAYHVLGQLEGDEEHPGAVEYFKQALVIHREIGDRPGEAADLGSLGNIYRDLGKLEGSDECPGAIGYYKQAFVIHQEIGDRLGEAADLGNLGLAYHALGKVEGDDEHPGAIEYYRRAFVINREMGYRLGEAAQLGNLGRAYSALEQMEQAIGYLERALVIDREIGYKLGEVNQLVNLGDVYCGLGEVEKAIEYLKQALLISREIGYRLGEAFAGWNLGLLYEESDPARAAELMSVRVEYEHEIGHPDAETHAERVDQIRARIRDG